MKKSNEGDLPYWERRVMVNQISGLLIKKNNQFEDRKKMMRLVREIKKQMDFKKGTENKRAKKPRNKRKQEVLFEWKNERKKE